MVSYTQKDVRIKVNNADLFCNSASIKYDANIQPKYNVLHHKNAYDYSASGPRGGGFSINYYITGEDPLSSNLYSEKTSIPLEFNGLKIGSGYLTSYSFQCDPFGEVQVSAELAFYGRVSGSFQTGSLQISDTPPLNVSDMTLSDGTVVTSDKIKGIKYSWKAEISPNYTIDSTEAVGVSSKHKKIDSDFSLYDYDLTLPESGLRESFTINLKDKNNNTKQSYYLDGQIVNKSIASKTQDLVTSDYSLAQAKMGGPVTTTISTMSPTAGGPGTEITLYGYGLKTASMGYVGEFECEIVSGSYVKMGSFDTIKMTVHPEIFSGYQAPVAVVTDNGYSMGGLGMAFHSNAGGLTF